MALKYDDHPRPRRGGQSYTGRGFGLLLIVAGAASGWGQTSALGITPSSGASKAQAGSVNLHPLRAQIAEIERSLSAVKIISQAIISPDGQRIAYSATGTAPGMQDLFISSIAPPIVSHRIPAASIDSPCRQNEPAWSPDSRQLTFLSDCASPGQMQIFVLDTTRPGMAARQLTRLVGYLAQPKWSPDQSTIAFLFVDHATRTPSPMAAGAPQTGVIDDIQLLEPQRIALLNVLNGDTRILTPGALNAFEFDWSRDSQKLAYTASTPPGDDNWYIAQLYTQAISENEGRSVYKPGLQIALPRWSPDGKEIAFISGLMSDEGASGGDIYLLPSSGGPVRNLTAERKSSPAWLQWTSPDTILFTEFAGGSTAISTLNVHTRKTTMLWSKSETIHAAVDDASLSLAADTSSTTSVVRESWTTPAEVWVGPIGKWIQVTHLNDPIPTSVAAGRVEDVSWQNDSFHVQGWLLFPQPYDSQKLYPMLVSVHGGPAWIRTPSFTVQDFNITAFVHLGYFVFLPNPRGSFGQGEEFTLANRGDWGFGDVRDIVSGVDAVATKYSIDLKRVGIIGWSYGGSTAMIAVGRTNRFRAAVAGAGASNLQSYYGQNQIDKWMLPYMGASVYDDPAAYMKSSALSYVKKVKTPTLLLVGERDEEAPPPQSFEFWHALKELNVPTQLVVYAGEGHSFQKYEDRMDLLERSAEWFTQYMPAP